MFAWVFYFNLGNLALGIVSHITVGIARVNNVAGAIAVGCFNCDRTLGQLYAFEIVILVVIVSVSGALWVGIGMFQAVLV